MRKILLIILLIISIELFSDATVHYYYVDQTDDSINYIVYSQDYITDQNVARWRSVETLYIDWIIEGQSPWWDNSATNPDSFTEGDIEEILWDAAVSWYCALPVQPTYLEDFEYGEHTYDWQSTADSKFHFIYDNSIAASLGLHPTNTGKIGGTVISTNEDNSERAITNSEIYVCAHPEFFNDYFWKKNSSSTSPGLIGQPLSTVITHEMGHVLGVGHITGETARMNSNGGTTDCTIDLTEYDERACWELYNFAPTDTNENNVSIYINYLKSNYPNPFNPTTTIKYSLSNQIQNPQIEIFNTKGQKVRSFQLEDIIGENSIVWNGKDTNNKSVSSGVYFYRLINDGKTVQSRKMLMLK